MIDFEAQSRLYDFHWIRERLSELIQTESAREIAQKLQPLPPSRSVYSHDIIQELKAIITSGENFPLHQFPDLRASLTFLQKEGAVLDKNEIFDIYLFQQQVVELLRFFRENKEQLPVAADLFQKLQPLSILRKSIAAVFDERGKIKDTASEELFRIRKERRVLENKLDQMLLKILKEAARKELLQEDNPTIRDGRLVLPLKSEHKYKIKGVIHGQSSSGQTTYVEPIEIVNINNEIVTNLQQEREEIHRILAQLSAELRVYHQDLQANFQTLTWLDYYFGCTRMAIQQRAIKPQLTSRPHLKLTRVRNPVLESSREVVPLDLEMDTRINVLLITGPNAGGKTVVIKTVALISAMALSGLLIPAEEPTLIPEFDNIFVDIGDQQSIIDDLSTFSAHLSRLRFILEQANSRSLVVIDEIGTGTDPTEGSALARSILEKLNQIGCKTLATTHHGTLKAFAQETNGILNAAMEFDLRSLTPTYRLQPGIPGNSYALEISERLQLPEEVLSRARALLGSRNMELNSLLNQLEQALQKVREKESELERHKRIFDKLIAEYEQKRKSLTKKLDEIRQGKVEELEELVSNANRRIENLVREIRERHASRETIKKAHKELDRIRQDTKRLSQQIKKEPQVQENLQPGDTVLIKATGDHGVVLEVSSDGQRILVDVNGKKLRTSPEALSKEKQPPGKYKERGYSVRYQKPDSYRLDLRGYRLEEARSMLDRFLNNSLLAGLKYVEIIHGKGNGILQTMVHEELRNFPGVKSFRFSPYEAGGPGVTEVEFITE